MSMTQTLAEFQDAFLQALQIDPTGDSTLAALTAQPGLAVYRNTVMKGCIDALAANYPAVARLVGDEWFRAAAVVFVQAHPPRRPMLVDYGDDFPTFLSCFEPAATLPYLPHVAKLDRFWTEAHVASDQTPIAATALTDLAPNVLARAVLRPHFSARWQWFPDQPIFSLWRCNRDDAETGALSTLEWRGEGVLLVRPDSAVEAIEISAGGCAFIDACAAGRTLVDAGLAALEADHDVDLSGLMALLLQAGAFGEVRQ